ncbi:MAG: DNA primase, partial [Clostridia bacterium]|nr:DNA primase [Clostridia bacterium]
MDFSEFCSRLLDKTDIVKLISRYATLRRMGNSYKACCPFHNEKTPSFSIDPHKQLYHCFGCGKGGNAITFLSEIESIDRFDAIKLLADEANMELPEFSGKRAPSIDKQQRLRYYELMRDAARHYHDNLKLPEAIKAREYIEKRNLPSNIVTRFGLGYSVGYDEMINYLRKKGYTFKEMKAVGLVEQKADKHYDVFHGRLIFPIINNFGQVVAFGGRVLEKTDYAKYRNSSQTDIFDKSRTVYALNLLKKKRQSGPIEYVVMCEGYMDVIALHKAGFDTAVASMGTALTANQAKQIKNYTDKVIISYDGDGAGQKATIRGLDILRDSGLTVKVASMPEGLDPDDVINKMGVDAYKRILDEAVTLTEYKLRLLRKKYSLSDRDEKTKYATEAVRVIKKLENPVEMEEYLTIVSKETGYDMNILRKQAELDAPVQKSFEDKKVEKTEEKSETHKTETFLLASLVSGKGYVNPSHYEELFTDGYGKYVVESVTESRLKGLKDVSAMLYSDLPDEMQSLLPPIIDFDFTGYDSREMYEACVNKLMCEKLERESNELAQK